ncbi:hypothetical protein [Phenylobacterium sp.]|uniref:terminase small subunit-like protein n=1 Tax=Phenylobacterium sp. TaxID=1871053 RepID=UPI0025FFD0FF|nr:hypothetical protein [Phenylobacterium sp.]MBX3483292.1 hypothetical protein [Phenylobacterium sp.]
MDGGGEIVCVVDERPAQKGLVRRLGGRRPAVRFSAVVARRICTRLEAGETLRGICADPDMPHRTTVKAWRKALPKFAASVERARRAAGWHMRGGHPPKWCEWTAREVCMRLAAGERMRDICADPDMPSEALVGKWRRERPQFAAALREARAMVAERLCEDSWEVAQAVTPSDAFATHVKLLHMRWMVECFDPTRFGRFKAVAHESVAAEAAAAPRETVFRVRRFEKVVGEDGRAALRELFPPGEEPEAQVTPGLGAPDGTSSP